MAVPVGHARKYAKKCVKCGGMSFKKEYKPEWATMEEDGNRLVLLPERLAVTCAACGYEWAEACLDKVEEDEA